MIDTIRPGLHRIEVPIPRSPLKAINSYVLTSEERSLVIDTGMRRPECEQALRAGLEELAVDFSTTDFFITHLHADHLGLVGELATETSRVYFNRPDGELIASGIQDPGVWYEPVIDRARKGDGPTLLEVKCIRWYGHFVGDPQKYRGKEAVEEAMKDDCLARYEELLLDQKVLTKANVDKIKKQVDDELAEAVDFARNSELPTVEELAEGLYV